MSNKITIDIRPAQEDQWSIHGKGCPESTQPSQAEAIEEARKHLAHQGGGTLIIHEPNSSPREIVIPPSSAHQLAHRIGQTVHHHRKAAGLTRKALSELSGVGTTALYQIETGHPTVRLTTLISVLEVLNIEMHLTGPLKDQIL